MVSTLQCRHRYLINPSQAPCESKEGLITSGTLKEAQSLPFYARGRLRSFGCSASSFRLRAVLQVVPQFSLLPSFIRVQCFAMRSPRQKGRHGTARKTKPQALQTNERRRRALMHLVRGTPAANSSSACTTKEHGMKAGRHRHHCT